MMSLTTAQRDLLQQLLTADLPLGAAALGEQLHLTPRQVQYGLRDIKDWLERRHVVLRNVTGVGVQVLCAPEKRQSLLRELSSYTRFQLVLTPEQRQQLLALRLLTANRAYTLNDFQQDLAVARATILKDLDALEPWLASQQLVLVRRQHRGCWIEGEEAARRQTLAAFLWGDVPFERPITSIPDGRGIEFVLAPDAALLPIVEQIARYLEQLKIGASQQIVTQAETALGGRFSDEAITHLALVCAIQQQRIATKHVSAWNAAAGRWVQTQEVWVVAAEIVGQKWPELSDKALAAETAAMALQFAASARDEPWQGDLGTDEVFRNLIDTLMAHIAGGYRVPELEHDEQLRRGLEAHILPACVRQRFGLWSPPKGPNELHTERYATEQSIAEQLTRDIEQATGESLPADAFDDLLLLLRAAILRARPERARRVLVVCPSGMATTQLLIARLRARFPRLGTFEVVPIRDLIPERLDRADLIISTVPLSLPPGKPIDVIQVHPMLRPDDVVALTQLMS